MFITSVIFLLYLLQLTVAVGKVKVTKPQFDYLDYQPKDPDMDYDCKCLTL